MLGFQIGKQKKGPANARTISKLQKKVGRENAKQRFSQLKLLEKRAEESNASIKKRLKANAAPKSTIGFIPYIRMMEDGICEIEKGLYSRALKFSDINYQTARQEEQKDFFLRYCEALNYCDPTIHLQINIKNRRIDKEDFRENMLISLQPDDLDPLRKEMNGILQAKALEGQNSILREKYLTFSTKAPNYQMAIPSLARIESDLVGHLKALGCETHSLNGQERVGLLHNIFRPEEPCYFAYEHLVESSLTTKSFIAPTSFDFTKKDYFKFGDYFGQVLHFQELPVELSDEIITHLSDIPIDMDITIHITAVDQVKALELVRKQIAFMEMEATERQDRAVQKGRNTEIAIPMETRTQYDNATRLLDLMENENQRMFKVTVLIYTYSADLDTLQNNVLQIMATGRQNNLRIAKLDLMQREGIKSLIPVGKNHVEIERTLTTASTAVFIPFTTMELYQRDGQWYGQNALSRNLIYINRYNLKSPGGMLLGSPGSGKSMAAKIEMIITLLKDPNAEVLIIDPEREYAEIAHKMNGELIHISAGSKEYINPMDCTMDYADDDEPLLLKAEFILTICELLIGGLSGLSAAARTIISRACMICYAQYFANPGKYQTPTLLDFYEAIKKQPEPEAQGLALELELYIEGVLSVFANRTNVDITKRLVVYDIRDLGKQLRPLGMIVVLDQIWNRITANRVVGKRTWIYIDEMQLLFNNEYSANYFFELWSRARKWGAIPTGITQNVETLLLSDLARRMLSNSDFIMMMNQAPTDRAELAGLLNMSNRQLSHITNSEAGHGLLFAGNSILPFVNEFPKDTELYRMMTTKIEEVVAFSKKEERELRLVGSGA